MAFTDQNSSIEIEGYGLFNNNNNNNIIFSTKEKKTESLPKIRDCSINDNNYYNGDPTKQKNKYLKNFLNSLIVNSTTTTYNNQDS